jgi:trimeric autotransporter adhesin
MGIVESWRGAGLLLSASGPDLHPLLFGINRVEKARIATNGNFGIGLTAPSFLLDVNGTVRATSFVTASDQRLKKDIRKLETPLQKISLLNGYYFKYSNEKVKERNFPAGESIGFMAQNVKEVLPQLVQEDADGYLTVDYQSVIPLLVEALKEIDNKVNKVQEQYLSNLPDEKNRNPLFKDAFINQNSPNPLTNFSKVEYFIPYEAGTGEVGIYDFHGTLIKSYNLLTKGKGTVEFSTDGMQPGMYFYTLIIDGVNVETKRLVVSKQ